MIHLIVNAPLTVAAGPMACGKSSELIRRFTNEELANKIPLAFHSKADTRSPGWIRAHLRDDEHVRVPAIPINDPREAFNYIAARTTYVFIDEVQFFPNPELLLETVQRIRSMGTPVFVSGLQFDFRGMPYETTKELLAYATEPLFFSAICRPCGNRDARYTQRFRNGKPVSASEPVYLPEGSSEGVTYEARCGACHQMAD